MKALKAAQMEGNVHSESVSTDNTLENIPSEFVETSEKIVQSQSTNIVYKCSGVHDCIENFTDSQAVDSPNTMEEIPHMYIDSLENCADCQTVISVDTNACEYVSHSEKFYNSQDVILNTAQESIGVFHDKVEHKCENDVCTLCLEEVSKIEDVNATSITDKLSEDRRIFDHDYIKTSSHVTNSETLINSQKVSINIIEDDISSKHDNDEDCDDDLPSLVIEEVPKDQDVDANSIKENWPEGRIVDIGFFWREITHTKTFIKTIKEA